MTSEMWLWEPTLLLRWRVVGLGPPDPDLRVNAEMLRVRGTTLVLEQLWRGRRGHLFDADFEIREQWREVPVVEDP